MAGKRATALWRQAFLRELRRTGNVRASAFAAGVDPGTAYDHRARDAGFRAKWAGAQKACKAAEAKKQAGGSLHRRSGGPPPHRHDGEELVLRRGKDGDKMVRAAPGRWSRRVEESFLDGLEATGCVTTAAAAAGISTNALYRRRDNYPEFRVRWEERTARFREQLPALINAAAVQSMQPDLPGAKRRGRARLPQLDPGEVIRVYAINENAKARGRGRRGGVSSQEENARRQEDLVETGTKLLAMMKRRRAKERLAAGWTEIGNGLWLPPGWTATPPPESDGKGDSHE